MDGAPLLVTGVVAMPWPRPGCACVTCASDDGAVKPAIGLQVGPSLHLTGVVPDGGPALVAGQTRHLNGVRLLALPASGDQGEAGVVLVVGVAGRTVLWAPVPGPLSDEAVDALQGAELDGAVLDVRSADGRAAPIELAHALARLRQVGALAAGADVAAVGLTHDSGPPERLAHRLAVWGVRIPAPGDALATSATAPTLSTTSPTTARSPWTGRRTLVLGAAASGKSAAAEELLAAEPAVLYAATGPAPSADDPDWTRRVDRHRARRPAWWQTAESPDLATLLTRSGPPVLLDSLGTWVTAALTVAGAWDDVPGWQDRYEQEVDAVVAAWRTGARRVVAVGEETGWGVVPSSSAGRLFRDALGRMTQRLADQSEHVLLVVAGRLLDLEPRTPQLEIPR